MSERRAGGIRHCSEPRRALPARRIVPPVPAPRVFEEVRSVVGTDRGAHAVRGQHLEQERARHASVDDVHRAHARAHGLDRRDRALAHFAVDEAFGDQALHFLRADDPREPAVAADDALRVGHQDQLLCGEGAREFARETVGQDVVGRPVVGHADRHDDRNELAREQEIHEFDVDRRDVADEAQVDGRPARRRRNAALDRADEPAVLSVDPHGAPAVLVDEAGQFLVQFVERHFDDGQRAGVGDAQALLPVRRQAHRREQFVDAPAAAVHDDRLHADQTQERHVAREHGLQGGVGHRPAAEADDDRLAVVGAKVGQRFGERAGGGGGGGHRQVGSLAWYPTAARPALAVPPAALRRLAARPPARG